MHALDIKIRQKRREVAHDCDQPVLKELVQVIKEWVDNEQGDYLEVLTFPLLEPHVHFVEVGQKLSDFEVDFSSDAKVLHFIRLLREKHKEIDSVLADHGGKFHKWNKFLSLLAECFFLTELNIKYMDYKVQTYHPGIITLSDIELDMDAIVWNEQHQLGELLEIKKNLVSYRNDGKFIKKLRKLEELSRLICTQREKRPFFAIATLYGLEADIGREFLRSLVYPEGATVPEDCLIPDFISPRDLKAWRSQKYALTGLVCS